MIFTLNPIHRMSQTLFIQQNIIIFIIATTFLFTPFVFLWSLLSTKNQYIFGFNLRNSSMATPPVLSFIFPMTNLFESS